MSSNRTPGQHRHIIDIALARQIDVARDRGTSPEAYETAQQRVAGTRPSILDLKIARTAVREQHALEAELAHDAAAHGHPDDAETYRATVDELAAADTALTRAIIGAHAGQAPADWVNHTDSGDTSTGPALRALRRQAGMPIEDVARKADVHADHLARVEAGTATPRPRWAGTVTAAIADSLQKHAQNGH